MFCLYACLLISISYGQTLRLPGSDNQPASTETLGRKVDLNTEEKLKRDIDNQALAVANRLMRCCSSYGGNNVRG